MIQVPARLGGGEAVGILGAETETRFRAAVVGAEGESCTGGKSHGERQTEGEGGGEAIAGADVFNLGGGVGGESRRVGGGGGCGSVSR